MGINPGQILPLERKSKTHLVEAWRIRLRGFDFSLVEKRVKILREIYGTPYADMSDLEKKIWINHLWARLRLRFHF